MMRAMFESRANNVIVSSRKQYENNISKSLKLKKNAAWILLFRYFVMYGQIDSK